MAGRNLIMEKTLTSVDYFEAFIAAISVNQANIFSDDICDKMSEVLKEKQGFNSVVPMPDEKFLIEAQRIINKYMVDQHVVRVIPKNHPNEKDKLIIEDYQKYKRVFYTLNSRVIQMQTFRLYYSYILRKIELGENYLESLTLLGDIPDEKIEMICRVMLTVAKQLAKEPATYTWEHIDLLNTCEELKEACGRTESCLKAFGYEPEGDIPDLLTLSECDISVLASVANEGYDVFTNTLNFTRIFSAVRKIIVDHDEKLYPYLIQNNSGVNNVCACIEKPQDFYRENTMDYATLLDVLDIAKLDVPLTVLGSSLLNDPSVAQAYHGIIEVIVDGFFREIPSYAEMVSGPGMHMYESYEHDNEEIKNTGKEYQKIFEKLDYPEGMTHMLTDIFSLNPAQKAWSIAYIWADMQLKINPKHHMNIDSVACELYAKYVEKLCWPSTTITHPAVEYYSHFWINARVEIMENSFLSWQKLQENQDPKQGFFAKLFKKKEKPLSGAYVPVQYCDNAFLTPKQWEMIDKKEVAEMHVNMCVRESSHELTVLLHGQAGKENPLKIHATTDSSFGRFNHVDVK